MPNLANPSPPNNDGVMLVIGYVDNQIRRHFEATEADIEFHGDPSVVVHSDNYVVVVALSSHLHENAAFRFSLEAHSYIFLQGAQFVTVMCKINFYHWPIVECPTNLWKQDEC